MNRTIRQLLRYDRPRWEMFRTALRYVDYECVPGDVVEFGVYSGRSLALLAHATHHPEYEDTHVPACSRTVYGFDSWDGMPPESGHPRWPAGKFATCDSWHPTIPRGDPVNASSVVNLFLNCQLPSPVLVRCRFASDMLPDTCRQIAVAHIDCDMYESTVTVLQAIGRCLQPGSVLLFDDWLNYRADPGSGEQRACREWLAGDTRWRLIPYKQYATFAMAFIVQERTSCCE
jgi:SAM-dependent methyltransferase